MCGICYSDRKLNSVYVYVLSCSVLSNSLRPHDCPPGSPVHGISQAKIRELVAISYSRGSSRPRDQTHVSCVFFNGRWILHHHAAWKPLKTIWVPVN